MKSFRTVIAAAALLSAASLTQAAGFTLSTLPLYTYGGVNSYSMPTAIDLTGGGRTNPYGVSSTPGAIQDLVVIFTGASGISVPTKAAGLDDATQAPSSGSGGQYASLLATKTMLAGGDPLFLFNNNEANQGQSLAVWARMWITDSAGLVYGRDLYLSNRNLANGMGGVSGGNATLNNGGGVATPNASTTVNADYALAGGDVCANSTGIVPCDTPGANTYTHNQGTNQAAYAGDVPLLNQWFSTLFSTNTDAHLAGYTFRMDVKLGCDPGAGFAGSPGSLACPSVQIDSDYEQLFLKNNRSSSVANVPEPAALGLVALGLMGVGLSRRHRAAR